MEQADMFCPRATYSISLRTVNTLYTRDGVHSAGKYLLLFFPKADQMLSVGEHMLSLTNGCAVALPPETPYSFSYGAVCEYYRVSLMPIDERTAAMLEAMTRKRSRLIRFEDAAERDALLFSVGRLHAIAQRSREEAGAYLGGHGDVTLAKILLDLFARQDYLRENLPPASDKNTAALLVSYLDENFKEPFTLDDLSQRFFHSKYYLCHQFKRAMRRTITEYVNDRRVEHACMLLLQTERSVSEICFESGFRSQQHFFTQFKAGTGKTPLQYRREAEG